MSKAIARMMLMLGGMVIATAMAAAADDEKSATGDPEKVLTGKELTKDDRKFLLDETAAIEKYEQAKKVYGDFQKAYMKQATIMMKDQAVLEMQMEVQALQESTAMLRMQMNSMGRGMGRMRSMANSQRAPLQAQINSNTAMLNQYNTQINAAKSQGPKDPERKAALDGFTRSRDAYIGSVRELNEVVAPLLAKYHELALDKEVTNALAELRHKTTMNYKLGPSDTIHAASKMIAEVKRVTTISSGKPASKKKTVGKSKASS